MHDSQFTYMGRLPWKLYIKRTYQKRFY